MLMYLIAEICSPDLIGLSALFYFKQVYACPSLEIGCTKYGLFTLQEWLKGMTSLQ